MPATTRPEVWPESIGDDVVTVAVVPLSRKEVERRTGLRFRPYYDDLDHLDAAIESEANRFAFVHYRGLPERQTDVAVPNRATDPGNRLDEALRLLDLTRADLTWLRPDLGMDPVPVEPLRASEPESPWRGRAGTRDRSGGSE